MTDQTCIPSVRYTVEEQNGDTLEWTAMCTTHDFEEASGLLTSEYYRMVDLITGRVTLYPGADLNNVEEARCFAIDFATTHGVDEQKAKSLAAKWFDVGDGFPARKTKALDNYLKSNF